MKWSTGEGRLPISTNALNNIILAKQISVFIQFFQISLTIRVRKLLSSFLLDILTKYAYMNFFTNSLTLSTSVSFHTMLVHN